MRVTSALFVAALAAAGASAQLIDFEDQNIGPIPGEKLLYDFGAYQVQFSGPGLQIRPFGDPFPTTKVLSTAIDAGPIEVLFLGGPSAIFVQWENIINGTYTGEVDAPIGTAYDAFNNVLDMKQTSDTFFVLNGPGIVRAVYVEGSPGEGFVMDNFSWEIPAPGAIGLLGLGALTASRRRRS